MPEPVIVVPKALSRLDYLDAVRDQGRAERFLGPDVGFNPENRLQFRILAYTAERAFALYLGLDNWKRDPDGFGKPDVLGFSVRLASKPGYGLVTHDRDHPFPYVLVESHGANTFRIAGWLEFDKALLMRSNRVGFPLPRGNTRPWCIPQHHLKPASSLPAHA